MGRFGVIKKIIVMGLTFFWASFGGPGLSGTALAGPHWRSSAFCISLLDGVAHLRDGKLGAVSQSLPNASDPRALELFERFNHEFLRESSTGPRIDQVDLAESRYPYNPWTLSARVRGILDPSSLLGAPMMSAGAYLQGPDEIYDFADVLRSKTYVSSKNFRQRLRKWLLRWSEIDLGVWPYGWAAMATLGVFSEWNPYVTLSPMVPLLWTESRRMKRKWKPEIQQDRYAMELVHQLVSPLDPKANRWLYLHQNYALHSDIARRIWNGDTTPLTESELKLQIDADEARGDYDELPEQFEWVMVDSLVWIQAGHAEWASVLRLSNNLPSGGRKSRSLESFTLVPAMDSSSGGP